MDMGLRSGDRSFSANFISVMIILAITAMMYVNRDVKIPGTGAGALVIQVFSVMNLSCPIRDGSCRSDPCPRTWLYLPC